MWKIIEHSYTVIDKYVKRIYVLYIGTEYYLIMFNNGNDNG